MKGFDDVLSSTNFDFQKQANLINDLKIELQNEKEQALYLQQYHQTQLELARKQSTPQIIVQRDEELIHSLRRDMTEKDILIRQLNADKVKLEMNVKMLEDQNHIFYS